MCEWTNDQTTFGGIRVLWLRIRPNSHYIKGRMLYYDHTTKNRDGHYLIMPAQMHANSVSILTTRLMRYGGKIPTMCFRMYYFAQGTNSSVVALNIRLIDVTRQKATVARVYATTGLYWNKFETEFKDLPKTYIVQIAAFYINGVTSDIGIDDIEIKYQPCSGDSSPTTTTPLPPVERKLDCDFDNGQCNWKYDQTIWSKGKFADRTSMLMEKHLKFTRFLVSFSREQRLRPAP